MIQFEETTNLLEVLCTLNEVYEKQVDPDMVMWLDNCPTGSNRWFVARERNLKVVGIYGLLPRYAVVNGIVVRAHLCNNVGVVKTHRGKGLFRELGKFATERAGVESDLFVGCSNPDALKGHLAAGWTHVADLDLMNGCVNNVAPISHMSKLYHEQPIVDHRSGDNLLAMKRDGAFRDWRYSRTSVEYKTMLVCDRWVVWKKYEGRAQVMEMNGWPMLEYLGGDIDLWAVAGSDLHAHLAGQEFETVYTRHLVIKPNGSCAMDPNAIRFELCDNETH